MRTGTRLLVKIGSPSAASVGARMAAIKKAKPNPSCGKNASASSPPSRMISGSPNPSRRAGRPASSRTRRMLSVDESANSTSARVISTMSLISSDEREKLIQPNPCAPVIAPIARKTIGMVIERFPSHTAIMEYRTMKISRMAKPETVVCSMASRLNPRLPLQHPPAAQKLAGSARSPWARSPAAAGSARARKKTITETIPRRRLPVSWFTSPNRKVPIQDVPRSLIS